MKDDNCIFCKLANKDIPTNIIYEDEKFTVILDASPATKGHALILPKNHAANIYELPDEDAADIFVLAKKLATKMTEELSIPTIGIGAGAGCSGQVLVYQDMLGMFTDYVPKFVKNFANVGEVMKNAFRQYKEEINNQTFPAAEHSYKIDDEVIGKLY